ncbi:hypothetical protein [Patulibacter defluvii]|uniref:hypothetical protein n=1 Tax=Patulibacter defluvii TaxID=3095358 RepID=UPI002A74D3D2|nr:hypothetical protein [Patulibacter sp. DM4]
MSPDRDAFGRQSRPAPSGWGPGSGSGPSSRSGGGGAGSGGGRPPSWRRLVFGFLAFDIVIAAIVGAVLLIGSSGGDSGSSGGTTAIVDGGPDGPRQGDAQGMLSPKGTAQAFARLRGAMRPGERITNLSIRPDYLSATVAPGPDQPARSLTVREGEDDVLASTAGNNGSDLGIALTAVDQAAPARLIAAARRGIGPRSAATVNYVVLSGGREEGDPPEWSVYLEGTPSNESFWRGDAHGQHVLRPGDGTPAPPEGQDGPGVRPFGLNETSLIRARNLRRALAAVRPLLGSGARVTDVSVWPERVSVTSRRRWVERRFTVDAAFGVERNGSSETNPRGGIDLGSVDVAAPERALDRLARRTRSDISGRINYLILDPPDGSFPGERTVWRIYLQGGNPATRYWSATRDGRRIGRPGTPGAP